MITIQKQNILKGNRTNKTTHLTYHYTHSQLFHRKAIKTNSWIPLPTSRPNLLPKSKASGK
jgi:hypothetical protein